jgi:RNA methyltransferase, RsmE family
MRQFLSDARPDKKGMLQITGKDYRYLRKVLRVRAGDMIEVRPADGVLVPMTVCQINDASGSVTLQICAAPEQDAEANVARGVAASTVGGDVPPVEYMLMQFIAKPQKMELIIRQAVECGVARIVPVIGEYSQKGSVDALLGKALKSERIMRIIREAREQSGSPVETTVHEPVTPAEAAALWKASCEGFPAEQSAAVVLSERTEFCKPLGAVVAAAPFVQRAAVAVGCEGGISPKEIEILTESGFIPVHFASNIMRCETAALYGVAALQTAVMDARAE